MLCLNKTTAWSEQGDISHWRQNKFREERENKRTLTDLRIPKTTASTRTFLQPGGGGTLCTNSKPTVGPYCQSRTRTPKHTLSLPRIEINLPAQCLENTLCKTIRAAQTELRKEGREQRRNERTGKVAFYLSQSFFFFLNNPFYAQLIETLLTKTRELHSDTVQILQRLWPTFSVFSPFLG